MRFGFKQLQTTVFEVTNLETNQYVGMVSQNHQGKWAATFNMALSYKSDSDRFSFNSRDEAARECERLYK